jgi:hypothetical protein
MAGYSRRGSEYADAEGELPDSGVDTLSQQTATTHLGSDKIWFFLAIPSKGIDMTSGI